MTTWPGIGEPRFGAHGHDFAVGVEEEIIAVDPETHALSHTGIDALARVEVDPADGAAHPDTYSALVELASPPSRDAAEAIGALGRLRAAVARTGTTVLGAGIHPDARWGDVEHVPAERYAEIVAQLRGLITRTPTCALHVHVGMPDAQTAIRCCNGLRTWLPLLQALGANSPFWFGTDSGLASARAQMFRAYPRSEIPPAWTSFEHYAQAVGAVVRAGDLPDYTFLWADIRLHPRLGTVEVRAMDSQSSLWSSAALAALVHGLALAEAESGPDDWVAREVLMEGSFRAARDGVQATLWHDGALRPVGEIAQAAVRRARPHLAALRADAPLDGVARIVSTGGGAGRQRAAFARGGMRALLCGLVDEAAAPYP